MKKKTVWSIIRDYINSKKIGDEVRRSELIQHVECEFGDRFSEATVDYIRNLAEKSGYLIKANKPGIFKVVRYFDKDLAVRGLRKEYDNSENKYK